MNGDYDPNAMFPKREKKGFFRRMKDRIKRWLTIIGLSALAIVCGSGCGSLRNLKEIDFGITGLEMEFYEPPSHPGPEDDGFFGSVANKEWIPASYPKLMQRNK